ncbi:MAG: HlyD family secretion protein [Phycisphaerales bacterium JB054]
MKQARAWLILVAVVLALGLVLGWQWWQKEQAALPEGIVSGNGRIEAVQVHVATKYAGRVESILAEEGDMVERGAVLATMDTTEFDAMLAEANARLAQAEESAVEASAGIVQQQSALTLAEQDLARMLPLAERGSASQRQADEAQSARDSAQAALEVARARARTAEKAIDAARASVQRVQVQLDECSLYASVSGRVLYRLAEPGEMLAAGGRVLTLLDLDEVYMEIFVPAQYATRLAIGAEARIIIDALPEYVIPAEVSFVAPEAQFTPKQVETHSERDKLIFRVKVRIAPEIVAAHVASVKTGVRGVAFVRVDDDAVWPDHLSPRLPKGN